MIGLILVVVATILLSLVGLHIIKECRKQYKSLDPAHQVYAKTIAKQTVLAVVVGFTMLFLIVMSF